MSPSWNPEERALDQLVVSFLAQAAPEDKARLATLFGEADHLGRMLPAYAVPGAIRACWLSFAALHARRVGDPWAGVLEEAAAVVLMDAASHMEPMVARSPDDPRELIDGP